MPIRSPHGRAAAYRVLWQWPLRSPRRLVGTAVLLLVLAAGLTYALGTVAGGARSGSQGADPATAAPGRPATSVPSTLPPVPELAPATLPLSQTPPAALDVARRFARAWVRPPAGTAPGQWLDGLRGTTTDEYLGVLAAVDPTNVPASRVLGIPKPVRVSAHSVQVQVQTDGPTLLVLVVDTDTGWRVAGYDRM